LRDIPILSFRTPIPSRGVLRAAGWEADPISHNTARQLRLWHLARPGTIVFHESGLVISNLPDWRSS
jgi:hypothetical protein